MQKSKIEYCDSTWNPVTGCYRNYEYCYAKKNDDNMHVLDEPIMHGHWEHRVAAPYPYYFEPTLARAKSIIVMLA